MKTTSPQLPFSVTARNPQPYTARSHPPRSAPHGGNTRDDDHSELFALDVVQEVLLQRLQHGQGQGVPLPGVVQDNVSARRAPGASLKDEPLHGRAASAFGSPRRSGRTRRDFPRGPRHPNRAVPSPRSERPVRAVRPARHRAPPPHRTPPSCRRSVSAAPPAALLQAAASGRAEGPLKRHSAAAAAIVSDVRLVTDP